MSRYEEAVEYLLREMLVTLQNIARILVATGIDVEDIEEDVSRIQKDVEKLVPEPSAQSATLSLSANP